MSAPGREKYHEQSQDSHADDEPVSKSQLKREAQALRSLADELAELPPSQLGKVPLDDDVLQAIKLARTLRSHGARRRQLQYVAKLIRRTDASGLIEALEQLKLEAQGLTAQQHRIEAWRNRMLEEGDSALGELLQQRPGLDIQALRQLIRNGQHERKAGKPPAAARALFRTLRELDQDEQLPPCL